ncbi:MAG: hypothetical protein ABIF87_11965 [Pseudomonadota bacterium]
MIDNHNDSIFTRLKPATIVELLAHKAEKFEEKDDIRRSRVLDVIPPHVIIEQPDPKLRSRRIGDTIEVTYLHRDKDQTKKRVMAKMKLVDIDRYQLKETSTEALFFVPSSDISGSTLRRHYRVEIPRDKDVVIEITDLEGEHIGLQQTYKVTDLSLQGLKFLCPRTVSHKGKLLRDPVGKLSTSDEILVRIFIDNEEILWAKSAIRTRIVTDIKRSNAIYFGIEFSASLTIEEETEKIRFETYNEQHKNALLPHITDLQRQLLKKQSDL